MTSYSQYKPTHIPWLVEIPEHWGIRRLKLICSFAYGGSLEATNRMPGDVPVYGSNGVVGYHESSNTLSPCIIVGRKGSSGKLIYSEDAGFAIDTTYFIDRRFTYSNLKWLYYALQCLKLDEISKDSAVPGLAREDAYNYFLPFVSEIEQQRIADFLDYKTAQIDCLIGKKKALIEKLNEKRIALITQTVTKGLNPEVPMKSSGVDWLGDVPVHWHVKRLRFAIQSNPLKSEIDELERDDLVSFVPMDAVGEYGGIRLDMEKPLDAVYDGYTYFRDNDVVIAKITPCFENGKGARAEELTNGVAFGTTELHVMRPLEGYSSRWLFYLSICHAFREIGASEMYGAGGQKRVPEGFIKNFRIGIPDFDEQESIADFIDSEVKKMDEMLRVNNLTIERLTEYRTALITAAVTGKIDVRGIDIPSQEAA
ncbi:MAG: restriction endonuclease subunit S [Methylobacter sp.]